MCIAIPMVVEQVDGLVADCVARGCRRRVSLVLLVEEDVRRGEHVLVHQGLAMRTVSAEEAGLIWEAFDLATSADGESIEARENAAAGVRPV